MRKTLLACGILSSLLYVAMTVLIGMRWEGYNSWSQTISELSAIGAPTRSVWTVYGAFYTVLVTAFGFGVWQSGARNRPLRIAGALIIAYGSLGLLWPFASMHTRDVIAAGGATLSDSMHLLLASITVPLMLLAIAFSAAAFGWRFSVYAVASLVILGVCGLVVFSQAPDVGANLPTPWVGLWERINVGTFLLWVIVLAAMLFRSPEITAVSTSEDRIAA